MAWPTANVSLTNVDADSDSISSARADIYSAFVKLNEIITNGPGSGNVTVYNDDNVAVFLPNYTGNLKANYITTTSGIYWSNGAAYSTGGGGGGSYGDADVAQYIGNTYTGRLGVGDNVNAGSYAGSTNQGLYNVAIGYIAQQLNANIRAVAVGHMAGQSSQGAYTVAVGSQAGSTTQGNASVAVGRLAAQTQQGLRSVAIGQYAGQTRQGSDAIALGHRAGRTDQASGSIVINARDADLNASNAGLYIFPVREDTGNVAKAVYYNTTTSELTYANANASYGNTEVAAYLTGNVSIGTQSQPQTQTVKGQTIGITAYGPGGASGTLNLTGHKTIYLLNGGTSGTLIRAETDNFDIFPVFAATGTMTLNSMNLTLTGTGGAITAPGNITLSNYGKFFVGNIQGNLTSVGTSRLGPYIETVYAIGNTGAGTITPAMANGPVQTMTATGNFTLAAPTGMSTGSSLTFIIRQDATGSRTCSFNASYKFAGGSKTLSTLANSIDVVTVFYDGTDYLCNLIKAYT